MFVNIGSLGWVRAQLGVRKMEMVLTAEHEIQGEESDPDPTPPTIYASPSRPPRPPPPDEPAYW